MLDDATSPAIDAWIALSRAQQRILTMVEVALKAAKLPPLSWYDVLLELDRCGTQGMRPIELERVLLLPQYRLSRLLARIDIAGYLDRNPCPQDGRGQVFTITRAGREVRRRMWPVYREAVHRAFGEQMNEADCLTLARRLRALLGDG